MPIHINLSRKLTPGEMERQLLLARAAKPLLATTNGTLLILDSSGQALAWEGPNETELQNATLASTAKHFRFSAHMLESIQEAFSSTLRDGLVRTLEDWAPPLGDPHDAYQSDSRRIQVYVTRLHDNDDTAPLAACLFHDMTEIVKSKTAEERAQKERLHLFLGSITDAVLATDDDWRIVYMNPSAASLLGVHESDANGQRLWSLATLYDCATNGPLEQLLSNHEIARESDAIECRLFLTPSTYRIATVRIHEYAGTDQWTPGFVVVLHDVTEERRRSHQDVLSRKMEAIGQLSAGIAHEINTPMQFVNDNARFLASSVATLTGIITSRLQDHEYDEDLRWTLDELPNALKETRDGIERVIKIVSAMKEFSHPSGSGKSPSDLNRGIAATTTVARNAWKYTAQLELDLAQDLPLVFCNLDEINQVVLNLVLNAVDAIKERQQQDGTVELGCIEVSTCLIDDNVVVAVRDDGTGLSDDVRVRMFDPFFTTKPVGKGTGQGLAVAHDVIVVRHGGRIEVESEVGRGTKFAVYLPYAKAEEGEL